MVQWLQQYAREDPEGATAREVPQTLTLLSSVQLQQEVASAVARETEVVGSPPEPGSIAVQAFGDPDISSGAFRGASPELFAQLNVALADAAKIGEELAALQAKNSELQKQIEAFNKEKAQSVKKDLLNKWEVKNKE